MKYAILSDIHANLQALEAVLADSRAQNCTHYACLGDVVGYGGKPKECLKIIRDMGMPCVKGNHDEYCCANIDFESFNEKAIRHVKWTCQQLNEDEREWLRSLPLLLVLDGFKIVHATLDGPQRWGYVFNKIDAASHFPYQETKVCFFGHTHVPLAFVREPTPSGQPVIKGGTYSKFKTDETKKHFVNVGSVGQPRDNNPKACYATYDLNREVIELRRIDYDIAAAQRDINDAGLPPGLAGN